MNIKIIFHIQSQSEMEFKNIVSKTSTPIAAISLKWSIENFDFLYRMSLEKMEYKKIGDGGDVVDHGDADVDDHDDESDSTFAMTEFNMGGDGDGIERSEWKMGFLPSDKNYVCLAIVLMKSSQSKNKVSIKTYLEGKNGGKILMEDDMITFKYNDQDDLPAYKEFVTIDDLRNKYLVNDVLHMTLEMKILGETSTDTKYNSDENPDSYYFGNQTLDGHQHVWKGIPELFKTGLHSDVTFSIKNSNSDETETTTEIKAHKLLLSLQSPVFAKMFNTEMSEAITNVISITDVSPESFKLMINSIYTGQLEKEWVPLAAELIYLSDKYELGGLKDFLDRNITFAITLDNTLELLKTVKLYKLTKAEATIKGYIKQHFMHFLDKMV